MPQTVEFAFLSNSKFETKRYNYPLKIKIAHTFNIQLVWHDYYILKQSKNQFVFLKQFENLTITQAIER